MGIKVSPRKNKAGVLEYWIFVNHDSQRQAFKIGSRSDAEEIAFELRRNIFFTELLEENLKLKIDNKKLLKRMEYIENQLEKQNRTKGPRKIPIVVYGD